MRGSDRNARLTAAVGAALLVLLAGEGVTILFIGRLLRWHEILGLVIIAPVLLKLATVSWKFLAYYHRVPDYVAQGPPAPTLRFLVAPVLVLTTIVLFASGVALIVFHIHHGLVVGVHKASFLVWVGAFGLHVLWHAGDMWRWVREAVASHHEAGSIRPQPHGHAARR